MDSSEVFRQTNYRGRIREVGVIGEGLPYDGLHSALPHIRDAFGYGPLSLKLEIFNIVHGGPEDNEPRAGVLVKQIEDDVTVGLITQHPQEPGKVTFYREFGFIP